MKRSKLVVIPQFFQKYQMMPDCAGHGGVLPIGDPELFVRVCFTIRAERALVGSGKRKGRDDGRCDG